MKLSPSAYADTFCRDHLPPAEQWPTLRFDLPELQYPERVNCATALLDEVIAVHGPDRPCLLTAEDSWTYGELLTRANQVAHVLTEDFGLVPGQRVLLRGPNNPWLVASWFGAVKAGGVVVTTMPMLRSLELGPLTQLTRPTVAICDHRFTEELASATPGLPLVPYGGTSNDDLAKLCAAKPGTFTDVMTAADDVAMLAATSGTTGVPKATMHFHRDVLAIADTFGQHLVQSRPTDVFTGTPPLGFTFGLGGLLVFPMRAGAATLLLERATPPELAEAVAHFGVTVLFTSPTAYRAMLRAGKAGALAGLRTAVSAGEPCPRASGTTSSSRPGCAWLTASAAPRCCTSSWLRPATASGLARRARRFPVTRLRCSRRTARPPPTGKRAGWPLSAPPAAVTWPTPGRRTTCRTAGTSPGTPTSGMPMATCGTRAAATTSSSRPADNIAPAEIELALEQHPEVAECAVVGKPDEDRGMIVHAAVVLASGEPAPRRRSPNCRTS